MGRKSTAISTPEQQAATVDLFNGWTRQRFLEALATTGYIEDACRISGIGRTAIETAKRTDESFREAFDAAKARFGEKLVHRVTSAVLNATDEQIMNHPTGPIAAVNWFNPDLRPNSVVSIDNRSVTLQLDGDISRRVSAALFGQVPTDSEVGMLPVPSEPDC